MKRFLGILSNSLCLTVLLTSISFAQDSTAATQFEIPDKEQPFWESAQKFVDAYAERDADAIGELFTEDADFLDELGVRTVGRDAIVERFREAFAGSPAALIESIDIVNVKHLGDSVAIEEGMVISSVDENSPRTANKYAAIHLKGDDGVWRISVLKDFPREDLGRHEQLAQLAWLIGDWVNESSDSVVETTCRWSEDGNYLLRKFDIRTAAGNEMSGVQRVGWDPVHKKLRSWTFDSEGGFFSGFWTQTDDGWVLTSAGVTADGETTTATAVYRIIDREMLTWRYEKLIVGDEIRSEMEPVTMVRRSPRPALEVSQGESH